MKANNRTVGRVATIISGEEGFLSLGIVNPGVKKNGREPAWLIPCVLLT